MIVFNSAQLCTMSYDHKNSVAWCVLDPGHPFYLHEFLEDSSLHLPMVVKPPRVSKALHLNSVLSNQACTVAI